MGGPACGRFGHSFSYDVSTNEAIIFGGAVSTTFSPSDVRNDALADLWLLKNANGTSTPEWIQLQPQGRKPIGHFFYAMVRDTANQVLPLPLGRYEDSHANASALC